MINVKAVLVRSTFMWTKASTQSIIATRFKSYDFVVQFEWIMLIHLIFDRFVIMAVTWLLNQLVEQKSIKFVFMSVTCLLPVVWFFWNWISFSLCINFSVISSQKKNLLKFQQYKSTVLLYYLFTAEKFLKFVFEDFYLLNVDLHTWVSRPPVILALIHLPPLKLELNSR